MLFLQDPRVQRNDGSPAHPNGNGDNWRDSVLVDSDQASPLRPGHQFGELGEMRSTNTAHFLAHPHNGSYSLNCSWASRRLECNPSASAS